jgi:hypothetical protein
LEVGLPICFAALLLGIKNLAEDSSTFKARVVEPTIRDDKEVWRILSFNDYVTAIVAKRQCALDESVASFRVEGDKFYISGIRNEGANWQVPFVKCDSRRCQDDGEDARKYCVYPILAMAPGDRNDLGGRARAEQFKNYVETRYPQLLDPKLTQFNDYEFVRMFDSNEAIESYVKDENYGDSGREKIGLAVIFYGDDETDFRYSLRVNATNFNAPEEEGRPATLTTPNTERVFQTFAREDNACTPEGGTPRLGDMENSCTGKFYSCSVAFDLIHCFRGLIQT